MVSCDSKKLMHVVQVRPFPARLERTASEATRMLPSMQQSTMAADVQSALPCTDKAVVANAV